MTVRFNMFSFDSATTVYVVKEEEDIARIIGEVNPAAAKAALPVLRPALRENAVMLVRHNNTGAEKFYNVPIVACNPSDPEKSFFWGLLSVVGRSTEPGAAWGVVAETITQQEVINRRSDAKIAQAVRDREWGQVAAQRMEEYASMQPDKPIQFAAFFESFKHAVLH